MDDALRMDVGQAAQDLPHHAPGQQVIQGPLIQGLPQRARAVLHLYVEHLLLAWRRKRGRSTCTVSTNHAAAAQSNCGSSMCSTYTRMSPSGLHAINTSRQQKHLQAAPWQRHSPRPRRCCWQAAAATAGPQLPQYLPQTSLRLPCCHRWHTHCPGLPGPPCCGLALRAWMSARPPMRPLTRAAGQTQGLPSRLG